MKYSSIYTIFWFIVSSTPLISINAYSSNKAVASYQFDGFKLGDKFGSKVMNREPYTSPCDDDPIDNRSRRFMIYGGLKCRRKVFPELTTVIFYIKYKDKNNYDQPIEAFAWLGGKYFNSRSTFPAKMGVSIAQVKKLFGNPVSSIVIKRSRSTAGLTLTAYRFKDNIYAIVNSANIDVVIGYIVGPMPENANNEQWMGLHQMYRRYTPK